MKKLILIKLGGSLITDKDKPFTAQPLVIRRLAGEIKEAKARLKNTDIIVGHGSGSFGHTPASKYQTQLGNIAKTSIRGFCLTADAAIQINRIVLQGFLNEGLPVVSFAPLSFVYTKDQKVSQVIFAQIKKALDIGLVPVIYGDVIMDDEMGFCIYSGEKTLDTLALKLSKYYKIDKIIMAGNTDGVYDKRGNTIGKITPGNFPQVKKVIGGSKSTDVTGGMAHKVLESLVLARKGITSIIINGERKNELLNTIMGKKHHGTEVNCPTSEVGCYSN